MNQADREPVIVNPDAFATSLRKRSYWLRRIERLQARSRKRNLRIPTRWYRRGTFSRNVRMCMDCLDGNHHCDSKRPCSCICRGELNPLLRHEER
jgi:hypothetical protein